VRQGGDPRHDRARCQAEVLLRRLELAGDPRLQAELD
jgi:hypothetical protein